jgi:hypothetical protein
MTSSAALPVLRDLSGLMPRDLHPLAKNIGERPPWLDQIDTREMLEELGVGRIYESSMDELLFSCPFDGHSATVTSVPVRT